MVAIKAGIIVAFSVGAVLLIVAVVLIVLTIFRKKVCTY